MWRLREGGDAAPAVVVAPVRALVQRLGPHVEDIEPVRLRVGRHDRARRAGRALVGMGYRREYQVEGRGEVAVRGSIVDVFPATAEHPVRIDQWGDEVERLSHFAVADQRSTHDIRRGRRSSRAASCFPTEEVRARAAGAAHRRAVGSGAVGAARRGAGVRRHGVVAAVAHRRRAPAARPASHRRSRAARRTASDARPRAGPARRGSRRWPRRSRAPGARRTTSSRACRCRSTVCSRARTRGHDVGTRGAGLARHPAAGRVGVRPGRR